VKNFFKQLSQNWENRDGPIFRYGTCAMDFGNWSDVGNFPGVREFTSSHAFVEEVGQTF